MRFQQITKTLAGIATAAALATPPVAIAAVDMFLKLDNIQGDSKDQNHAGEIQVQSFSWGESKSTKPDCVAVSDISLTKFVDIATPTLIQSLSTGQPVIPKAKLTVRKSGDSPLEFVVIEMSNVTVASVQTAGHGGDDLSENLTLNFSSLKFTYTPPPGPPGSPGPCSGITARTCK